MKNLFLNLNCSLLYFYEKVLNKGAQLMFLKKIKKMNNILVWIIFFSFLLGIDPVFAADAASTSSSSGLFSELTQKGIEIFEGMRDIIYVVSGFGIIAVAIGGFFGNINWKWLGAIVIGLMVIGLTGGIITYIGGSDAPAITDTLK